MQLCLYYIRNFLQLVRTPAFASYTWFHLTHHGLFHCVFLVLTYLIYNRDSENAHLARYFVDEVIDIFVPDYRSLLGKSDLLPGSQPDKRTDEAWAMVIKLRSKLDIPSGSDHVSFKPSVPVRCVPLSSAPLSGPTASLEKPSRTAVPISSGDWERQHLPANVPAFPILKNLVAEDQGNYGTNPDDGSRFNISDVGAWASSLAQDTNDYLWLDQDAQRAMSNTDLAIPSGPPVSAPPAVYGDSVDYFDKLFQMEGLSEAAPGNEGKAKKGPGVTNNGHNGRAFSDESGGVSGDDIARDDGSGAQSRTSTLSSEYIATLADKMMDDRPWID